MRNLHPGQFPMFMTAGEIKAGYKPLPADKRGIPFINRESDADLWARKRREADKEGLTKSVQAEGVRNAVQLGVKGMVFGGHHRIAAARPDQLVPVLHYELYREAKNDPAYPYGGR